jgi:hypothetical protein
LDAELLVEDIYDDGIDGKGIDDDDDDAGNTGISTS